jgi:predicted PurR-regulated permease PerM
MTRQQVFSVCFFSVLALLLYQIALMFRPFLIPVLWALILAYLTFPVHVRLSHWLRGRQTFSAAILTSGAMVVGVVPIVLLGSLLVKEAVVAEQAVRQWVASGWVQRLPEQLAKGPFGLSVVHEWVSKVALKEGGLEQFLISSAKALSQFLVGELSDLIRNAFLLVANFFFMVFTLFFFFRDGKRWASAVYDVIPLDASHKRRIFDRLDQTIRAVVKGMFLTAITQGVLAGAAYGVLGVPFPVVLTALTILVAPIPLGGTGLVWGPVALYLLWVGPIGKGLVMIAWGIGVVSMVDHILKPLLIGQGAQIPMLLLTFGVLGGLALYGVIGLFLGPILVGLLLTAIQIYREEYHSPEAQRAADNE